MSRDTHLVKEKLIESQLVEKAKRNNAENRNRAMNAIEAQRQESQRLANEQKRRVNEQARIVAIMN
jgi:hypothetical protein